MLHLTKEEEAVGQASCEEWLMRPPVAMQMNIDLISLIFRNCSSRQAYTGQASATRMDQTISWLACNTV